MVGAHRLAASIAFRIPWRRDPAFASRRSGLFQNRGLFQNKVFCGFPGYAGYSSSWLLVHTPFFKLVVHTMSTVTMAAILTLQTLIQPEVLRRENEWIVSPSNFTSDGALTDSAMETPLLARLMLAWVFLSLVREISDVFSKTNFPTIDSEEECSTWQRMPLLFWQMCTLL